MIHLPFEQSLLKLRNRTMLSFGIIGCTLVFFAVFLLFSSPLYFGDADYMAGAYSIVHYGTMLDVNGNPLVHWPPMTSFFLVPIYLWSIPFMIFVRVLNLVSLIFFAIVTYMLQKRLVANSLWAGVITALCLLWYPVYSSFLGAQSEPFFFVSIALIMYAFIRIVEKWDWRWYGVLIAASAFSVLTRYSGLFIIVSVAFSILVLLRFRFLNRVYVALSYVIFSCLGLALWFWRNAAVAGVPIDRKFFFAPPSLELLFYAMRDFLKAIGALDSLSLGLIVMFTFLVMAILFFQKNVLPISDNRRVMVIFFIQSASMYVVLLFVINLFVDVLTTVNMRLLAPALYLFFLAATTMLYWYIQRKNIVGVSRYFFLVIFMAIVFLGAVDNMYQMTFLHKKYIAERKTIIEVQAMNLFRFGNPVYSNAHSWLFYFAENRFIINVPYKLDPFRLTSNDRYDYEVRQMISRVRSGGVIIYVGNEQFEKYQMPLRDLRNIEQLQQIYANEPIYVFKYRDIH